jgi:hypothetical protein
MSIVPVRILRVCAASLMLMLAAADRASVAETLTPVATEWKVQPKFKKSVEARTNLSGAACVPTEPPFVSCLIVNDQKKYAQFFAIDGATIVPGALIRLAGDETEGDPDAEGAAYADGFFYVIGSHGRSRHGDKAKDSSYAVFRFPVDRTTGRPPFQPSDDEVVGVASSGRLRGAVAQGAGISEFYDQPLAKGGVNIEGIAVKDGRMYLGLRGPSVDGYAFILGVDADATFTKDQDLAAVVARLRLGKDTGIRDLAAVRDGVLVLSGPVNEQQVDPALFHWNEKTGVLKELGVLRLPQSLKDSKAKAEILLVLEDQASTPWRVLIMFDGPENGAPIEYLVPR